MKKRNAHLLWTFFIGISLVMPSAKSQNAMPRTAQSESIKLAGSDVKVEDAVSKSDAIFMGEITFPGYHDNKALGEDVYRSVQIKVLKFFEGSLEPKSTFTLRIFRITDADEHPPQVGSFYIFFVKKTNGSEYDPYVILKLIPATDDNITKVKALIDQNAASQQPVTQPVSPVDQSASPQPTPVPEAPSPTPTQQPSIPPEPPVANETSETSIPIWTYGIIILTLGSIVGLWYFLRAKK